MANIVEMRNAYQKEWKRVKDIFKEHRAKEFIQIAESLNGDEEAKALAGICIGLCGMKAILEELEEDILEESNG